MNELALHKKTSLSEFETNVNLWYIYSQEVRNLVESQFQGMLKLDFEDDLPLALLKRWLWTLLTPEIEI